MKVAGKKLAKQSLAAHEMGEFRIRAGLKHKGDAHGLGKEHRQHAEERAAAISYVMNTGNLSEDILAKWKSAELKREAKSAVQ